MHIVLIETSTYYEYYSWVNETKTRIQPPGDLGRIIELSGLQEYILDIRQSDNLERCSRENLGYKRIRI